MITDISEKDIYTFAIEIEKNGIRFYNDLAEKTKNIEGKKMFLKLSDEENHHILRLIEGYNRLVNQDNILTPDSIGNLKISDELKDHFKDTFSEDALSLRKKKELSTDLDAIEVALNNEKESINFYQEINKIISNKDINTTFNKLIDEERRHIAMLNNHYDYLNKTDELLCGGDE